MEELKMTIDAIRVNMKMTKEEFANAIGIKQDRCLRLISGESKLYADELVKISDLSGVPCKNIIV